ncbi:MAG: type III toxin-antitoxin system ToxN/AbiQ family toxin [Erysipelotrichaceae bacterium]|nr:type III toxin-antitoxin system ToxN/AbiQ family toxin [Erysipelotrichaceae bacterium]
MKTAFYFVDEDYINFLKEYEIKHRGFTTVPNVVYTNRNKFLYGTVLEVERKKYFVPISSYSKKYRENLLIKIQEHGHDKVVGSLRFNYMIPVPDKCVHIYNFKECFETHERRIFIEKEYRYCKSKRLTIQKYAKDTYIRVVSKSNEKLLRNSCDFKLLEQAYEEHMNLLKIKG